MKVLTTGTFDIPHAGHASFLRQAARLGDSLRIGVLSDDFVEQYKGRRPLYNEQERAVLVSQMANAPAYVISDQRRFFLLEGVVGATIIAVGSDWAAKDYYNQIGMSLAEFEKYEYTLAYIPYTQGISASDIIQRVRGE